MSRQNPKRVQRKSPTTKPAAVKAPRAKPPLPAKPPLRTKTQLPSKTPLPAKTQSAREPEYRPESGQSDDNRTVQIVGIGASAGGLEALDQFLRHVPLRTGMAFVIVQH